MEKRTVSISDESIIKKIITIRGVNVLLDKDLADLYGVETKVLKQAVKRNIERFPPDFMFVIDKQELMNLRSQIVTSSWGGERYLPMVFTEHGVLMLSSVLRTDKAIQTNIQIIRIFNRIREFLFSNKDLLLEIESIKKQVSQNSGKVSVIWDYLKKLEEKNAAKKEYGKRVKIGYKFPSKEN